MEREHLQNPDVNRSHEPVAIPLNRPPGTFSHTGGEGRDEGARFMESSVFLSDLLTAHEPELRKSLQCRQATFRFMGSMSAEAA